MKVSRLNFKSPILCIDDFMSDEEAASVLQECIDLKKIYMPATIIQGPAVPKLNTQFRKNDVVYLDDVFRSAPERSDILTLMKRKIWTEECRLLWHQGDYIFDIINYCTWQTAILSRYGNCDFYKRHRDTRNDQITNRLVTLVYYVNTIPERFTGGALTFWSDDQSTKVEPKHNRAVVFPSFTLHEVENVRISSDKWEDGRFSLNYWMGFRSASVSSGPGGAPASAGPAVPPGPPGPPARAGSSGSHGPPPGPVAAAGSPSPPGQFVPHSLSWRS
jgi:2OG-Fe(II) oxygenase superfamily